MINAKEIELHPGHWKNVNSGANSIINEVTEARKVTKRVYEILQANKVPSTYFEDNNSTNQSQNLNTLVKHHNADHDGLVVSIHFNASVGVKDGGIGTEVMYYDQKELAAKIASSIHNATDKQLLNRGAKLRKDLAVLANTYEPAVLIEVCFVNSKKDVEVYKKYFEQICQAIAETLAEAIGKTTSNNTKVRANNGALIEFDKSTEHKEVFRVQSGPVSREKAIELAKNSGFPYNSIIGFDK